MFKSKKSLLQGVVLLAISIGTVVPFVNAAQDAAIVKVAGTLRLGIVAIGGETTGVVLKAKGVSWELDFARNAELKQAAEKLNGHLVNVEGRLEHRNGVEVKDRQIIVVSKLWQ